MAKLYHFHFETFLLPEPYADDWYQEFEMKLADEPFDRICKAYRSWIDNENFLKRDCLLDDGDLIKRDLSDIWAMLRAKINELAIEIWGDGIQEYLDEVGMYIPKEAWHVNCSFD